MFRTGREEHQQSVFRCVSRASDGRSPVLPGGGKQAEAQTRHPHPEPTFVMDRSDVCRMLQGRTQALFGHAGSSTSCPGFF